MRPQVTSNMRKRVGDAPAKPPVREREYQSKACNGTPPRVRSSIIVKNGGEELGGQVAQFVKSMEWGGTP